MEPVKIRIFSMIKDDSGESQTTEQSYEGTMSCSPLMRIVSIYNNVEAYCLASLSVCK